MSHGGGVNPYATRAPAPAPARASGGGGGGGGGAFGGDAPMTPYKSSDHQKRPPSARAGASGGGGPALPAASPSSSVADDPAAESGPACLSVAILRWNRCVCTNDGYLSPTRSAYIVAPRACLPQRRKNGVWLVEW